MTQVDTDTLAGLLAECTQGPWQMSGSRGAVQNIYGHDVGPDGKPVAVVDYPPPGRHASDDIHRRCRANARLIALAPELAAETIALRAQAARDKARIERLEAALRLLAGRSESLVHAHRHGNGMEGWYLTIDGVDRAVTAARAALEDGE